MQVDWQLDEDADAWQIASSITLFIAVQARETCRDVLRETRPPYGLLDLTFDIRPRHRPTEETVKSQTEEAPP